MKKVLLEVFFLFPVVLLI